MKTLDLKAVEKFAEKAILLRMTDGYGIATDYVVKNECPYCQAPITNVREKSGCYDGEFTYVHNFDCSAEPEKHVIQYSDILKYNGIKR